MLRASGYKEMPVLSCQTLLDQLEGKPPGSGGASVALAPCYYLFGEERYLIDACQRALISVWIGTPNTFCLQRIDCSESEVSSVVDQAHTLTLGAPKRVLVLQNADRLSADDLETWNQYLDHPSRETLIIFRGGESVDQRRKFFKRLGEAKGLCEAGEMESGDAQRWLDVFAKDRGHRWAPQAKQTVELLVGNSLFALEQAVEKISLLVGPGELLTVEAARQVLAETREAIVWDLTDALGEQNMPKAYAALHRIMRGGDSGDALQTMGAVSSFLRRMLWIRAGQAVGQADADIAKAARTKPGAIFMAKRFSSGFPPKDLRSMIGTCWDVDRTLKRSGVKPELVLQRFFQQIGALSRRSKNLSRNK